MDEYEGEWYAYEGGATVGEVGPEGGLVLRDEELGDPDDEEEADARLTLEQGRAEKPGFFLTATLYGWLFHTFQSPSEEQAGEDYELMKTDVANLAALLPYEDDKDVPGKVKALGEAIARFEKQWT